MTKDILNNLDFILASSQLFPVLIQRDSVSDVPDSHKALDYARNGLDAFENSDFEQALQIYSKAIAEFPQSPFFYACRYITSITIGEAEEGFYDYARLVKLDKNYCEFLTYLLKSTSDFLYGAPEAQMTYSSYDEIITLGASLTEQGEWSDAIELYTDGMETFGFNPFLMRERARLYIRTLQYNLAYTDLLDVISRLPLDAHAYLYLGMIFDAVKDKEEALVYFNRAIELDPEHAIFFEQRAVFYAAYENRDAALEDYTRCIELDNSNSNHYLNRSFVYEEMEDFERALRDANTALTLDSLNADIYIHRSELRTKMLDFEGAERDLEIAKAMLSEFKDDDSDKPDSIEGWEDDYRIN